MSKPVIGVMGASASDAPDGSDGTSLTALAEDLGAAIAKHGCILITGATTGVPDAISRSARRHGGFALGVSPAHNRAEHIERYGLPADGADVIVYTGFGLKGRNVVNVRSCDIVIVLGGATGTLNEFTIAYDEGKIVGVLEGSGGCADHIRDVIDFCKKPTRATVLFDTDPASLVARCLDALRSSAGGS